MQRLRIIQPVWLDPNNTHVIGQTVTVEDDYAHLLKALGKALPIPETAMLGGYETATSRLPVTKLPKRKTRAQSETRNSSDSGAGNAGPSQEPSSR